MEDHNNDPSAPNAPQQDISVEGLLDEKDDTGTATAMVYSGDEHGILCGGELSDSSSAVCSIGLCDNVNNISLSEAAEVLEILGTICKLDRELVCCDDPWRQGKVLPVGGRRRLLHSCGNQVYNHGSEVLLDRRHE